MSRHDVRWKPDRTRSKPAVKKRVEVIAAPILEAPGAMRGQAPTRATPAKHSDDLRDLLPPLDAAVRARLVEALADLGLAALDAVNTADDRKE
jgi:hypothetical protein